MRQLLILCFILCSTFGFAGGQPTASSSDSLVLIFGNKTRMVIHSTDKNGIQELAKYDLNRIIRDMGLKLDSTDNGNTLVMVDKNNSVRYLRDTVIVVTKKDGNVTVTIRESNNDRVGERQESKRSQDRVGKDDEDYTFRPNDYRRKNGWSRWSMFSVNVGLNLFTNAPGSNALADDQYQLRPIGSRFVSLAIGQRPVLARGRRAALSVYYGLEFAWNNFMFENDNTVRKGPAGVEFVPIGQEVQKSKLTAATIGIPLVPRVSFYNQSGKKVFHIGAGPYVNYRIDSYTKIKYENDEKDRFRSNYYLNDLRYGLMTHLGIGKTNFFVRYDLNPLFEEDRGPDLRALSFGITL